MAGPRQPDLAHERCWMCGIRLPTALLVPDGGSACADVRWYCRDLRACTGRWTVGARPYLGGPGKAVGGKAGAS